MLAGPMPLHDIRDVEAFCERAISRSGLTEFGYLDRDDLLAECIAFVWTLSLDTACVTSSFSGYAGDKLSRFIVDWKRKDFRTKWVFKDRVYERARPQLVSLEHRPDEADQSGTMDAATGGLPDLLGLQRARGGRAARRDSSLGESSDAVAA